MRAIGPKRSSTACTGGSSPARCRRRRGERADSPTVVTSASALLFLLFLATAADAVHGEQDAEGQTDERGEQHEGERAASVLLPGVDELLGTGGGGRDDERDGRRDNQRHHFAEAMRHGGPPHVRAGTGAGAPVSCCLACSASSRSRQWRSSRPRPKSTPELMKARMGGSRS